MILDSEQEEEIDEKFSKEIEARQKGKKEKKLPKYMLEEESLFSKI